MTDFNSVCLFLGLVSLVSSLIFFYAYTSNKKNFNRDDKGFLKGGIRLVIAAVIFFLVFFFTF